MLSPALSRMREQTRNGDFRKFRRDCSLAIEEIAAAVLPLSTYQAPAEGFRRLLALEKPVVFPGERLHFTRTIGNVVRSFPAEPNSYRAMQLNNLAPDYEILLQQGIEGRLAVIDRKLTEPGLSAESRDFLTAAATMLNSVLDLSERYAKEAEKAGDQSGAALLRRVPRHPAATLQEALQSIYFITAMIRLSGGCHIGFARTDQYLLDFYRADLAAGRESEASARDLLTEFFLKLNRDSDLYFGMQSGDNGQSMMLGGCDRQGRPAENELTLLLLEISADVALIEPKINLRVSKGMDDRYLRAGARLSGCGLGFPQYCNDDVVIDGLVRFGYPLELARGYTVAACWEFVVRDGLDVPNLYQINLPLAADRAIRAGLKNGEDFAAIQARVPGEMRKLLQQELRRFTGIGSFAPNPLFSCFSGDSLETGRELGVYGGRHRYFGCHGCGSSTAADSLAAVKKFVFDEKRIPPERLVAALESNYENDPELRRLLKEEGPHVGCGSAEADAALKFVFDVFADVLQEVKPGEGGPIRPGTGSAMNYVWMTQVEGPDKLRATADGRREGEFISSSLAPAPGVTASGILSVFSSYRNLDYRRLCNGGPITMELDPAYFASPAAVDKMVSLLRAFHDSGCQQLQINVLDAKVLRHAQQFPEQHRDLVVRVWGWSGYFVELDRPYQEQIIGRQAFCG